MRSTQMPRRTQYGAITIDTNLFVAYGLNLQSTNLADITKFQDGDVQIILSEIVVRELENRLCDQIRQTIAAFKNVIRKGPYQLSLSANADDQLTEIYNSLPDPMVTAKSKIETFLKSIHAKIIPVIEADINAVIDRYFGGLSPFQGRNSKCQFPDAIALMSIESWASKNQKSVLAISGDKQWNSFAQRSEWIHVEEDISFVIPRLHPDIKDALQLLESFLSKLNSGKYPAELEHLITRLRDKLGEWSVCLGKITIGDARDWSEPLWVDLQHENLKFLRRDNQYDVNVVQIGTNHVEFHIGVMIEAWAIDSAYWCGNPSEQRIRRTLPQRFSDTRIEFKATMSVAIKCDLWSDKCSRCEISDADWVDLDSTNIGNEALGYKIRAIARGM